MSASTTTLPGLIRRHRPAVFAMVGVTLYGIVGYMVFLGWSLREAAYMTVITLSTIGYKEVRPLGTGGELFTMSLILFGVTTLFAVFFAASTEIVMSGDLQKVIRRARVRRDIGSLRDHYIICGFGRVGVAAANEFVAQRIPVVIITNNPERDQAVRETGLPYLSEDATSEATLRAAGIEHARGLVCAMDSDALNVYVTLTGRSIRSDLVIVARASSPDSIDRLQRAGADRVVQPYTLSGRLMASLSMRPAVVDFVDLVSADHALRLEELMVRAGSVLDGLMVADVAARFEGTTMLALQPARTGTLIPAPPPETRLGPGDLVVVLGPVPALHDMAE
ncbi:MAG: potassium channel protein [Thermoleophilia bacterium]